MRTLILAALTFFSAAAFAAPPSVSVRDLRELCERGEATDQTSVRNAARATCIAYLDAVVATVNQIAVLASADGRARPDVGFCVRPDATEEDLVRLFLASARRNPQHANVAAASIASAAFAEAWPCRR